MLEINRTLKHLYRLHFLISLRISNSPNLFSDTSISSTIFLIHDIWRNIGTLAKLAWTPCTLKWRNATFCRWCKGCVIFKYSFALLLHRIGSREDDYQLSLRWSCCSALANIFWIFPPKFQDKSVNSCSSCRLHDNAQQRLVDKDSGET